jgi:hypothetical protein
MERGDPPGASRRCSALRGFNFTNQTTGGTQPVNPWSCEKNCNGHLASYYYNGSSAGFVSEAPSVNGVALRYRPFNYSTTKRIHWSTASARRSTDTGPHGVETYPYDSVTMSRSGTTLGSLVNNTVYSGGVMDHQWQNCG